MAVLTTAALTGYRDYTKRTVAYAQYKIGSTYYKAAIESVSTLSDGTVEIAFTISNVTDTVTQVQIYDTAGQLWYQKTESLSMADVSTGFYYVVDITIEEVTS